MTTSHIAIEVIDLIAPRPAACNFGTRSYHRQHASPSGAAAAHHSWPTAMLTSESGISSHVKSGENAGSTLEHAPVVRSMTRVGEATGSEFDRALGMPAHVLMQT
jgi:hypothetical protein